MNPKIIEALSRVTDEERQFLYGSKTSTSRCTWTVLTT